MESDTAERRAERRDGMSLLCVNCFHIKGDYAVCPRCGYAEGMPPKVLFHLRPGTILEDRYIIGGVIGWGGFGITYKAYDTVLSIMVAVKENYPARLVSRQEGECAVHVFSGNRAVEYRKRLSRFIEEARNMALFSIEKDIVNVLDYFESNGTAYIIMEYIDAVLLKKYVADKGKMPENQACNYLCSLLSAIQKMHDRGIIHKDISPDNIFLVSSEQVKIFDFGAARLRDSESNQELEAVVKTGYSPPEQYGSEYIPDFRADVYAAGAVLYLMLTGQKPLEAPERQTMDNLILPSGMGIHVQPAIERCMMKAMALKPENRYSSAREFRDAVRAALRS